MEHAALWDDISRYSLDDPKSSLTISRRLALENDWSHGYALRVIEEYKKFVFLAMVAGHKVTPSDEVDQAWHLHLIHTEEYWFNFCAAVLPRNLDHGPTRGGAQEDSKFDQWYTKTKESYRRIFETEPPLDIWPDNEARFGRRFVRVCINDHVVIKKADYPIISRVIVIVFKVRQFVAAVIASVWKRK